MRILHLTTGISKQSAVYRLHKAYLKNGIDSFIYAGLKSFEEDRVFYNNNDYKLRITGRIERQLLKLYLERDQTPWNIGFFNNTLKKVINDVKPDIIHLHWINQFVSIKQIAKFNIPVVWTMHDSWAFTGGCHIPFLCEKFKTQCEACPQLNSKRNFDLSKVIFDLKKKAWKNANINFIGPSKWMTNSAQSSKLLSDFPITNIPNCIDTDFFSSKDKIESRTILKIPLRKKIILFGANNAENDKNKGYDLLEKVFNEIKKIKSSDAIELVIFGTKDKGYCDETKIRKLGFISDSNQFPLIYSAADVVVNASRSENFSNVILESLSCGTPVVAFDIGGNSDLIKPNINGSLVAPFDVKEFAIAIINYLDLNEISTEIISNSIRNYSEEYISKDFESFYKKIIK
jgi:glycosyltransferase involved in cell wall biosynthesis